LTVPSERIARPSERRSAPRTRPPRGHLEVSAEESVSRWPWAAALLDRDDHSHPFGGYYLLLLERDHQRRRLSVQEFWSHCCCRCGSCHHHLHCGSDPAEDVQQENEDQAGAGAQGAQASLPICLGLKQQQQPAPSYCDLQSR
ncbi:unnamed protein product, partial [Gulo gulo]